MVFINDENKKQVSEVFAKEMSGNVNLFLFHDLSSEKCPYCKATMELVKELSELDKRITLTVYDINKNQKEAKFLGVDKVPAIVVGGKKIYNVLYFGIPAGYEFSSLVEDIIEASKGVTSLSDTTKEQLKKVSKPIDIKVFVTPSCPYCPGAVRLAHQFAMENSRIRAAMIEAQEFMELSTQYNVMGVPRTVINDSVHLEGAQPEEVLLEHVLKLGA
ncbi:MAG: thioredoxin family protein [Candidatus Marsarchaeota archaeon]|jgi:glutaredoxin-like protein|nr:thioredoxin family protein [Candidatus Marsarchaeota archaeon]